jgi:uncharacterized repeat protein (TIGR03806 family)
VPVTTLAFPTAVPRTGSAVAVDAFPLLPDFASPVHATHAPSGADRVFVVEQRGRIWVVENDPGAATRKTFLDLSSRVAQTGSEEGLLSLAFHPEHGENGQFVVCYAEAGPPPARTVVARYRTTADPDVGDPASEERLLVLEPPQGNHNGGMLAFGPDGLLYLSVGDGGGQGDPNLHGQRLDVLFGKILRIDVDSTSPPLPYGIPADNPFAASTGGERREIWAFGFRNPWRISFDRTTGTLWCGDVGQYRREEVAIVRKGENHGWRAKEGTETFDAGLLGNAPFAPPVLDYGHVTGTAVIGGHVYRGSLVPALYGSYVYGDYSTGTIWGLSSLDGLPTANVVLDRVENPSSFGEDRAGEILVCGHLDGRVRRLVENDEVPTLPFPQRLSETGIFEDVATLEPAAGILPYDVNVPLWADGASKDRLVALPGVERIGFSGDGAWRFPAGTALVKTFRLPLVEGDPSSAVRVETRVLLLSASGWDGFVYRWRDDQTDADLLSDADARTFTVETETGPEVRTWAFPGRGDCARCHSAAAGRVLGLTTRQTNRPGAGGTNQLTAWASAGMFDAPVPAPATLPALPAPDDEAKPVALRARAWLEVHCAVCHQPSGTQPAFDLRASTPIEATGLVDALPQHGDLGVEGARLLRFGDRARSVLWLRAGHGGAARMPPLLTSVVDEEALDLLGRWIDEGP